ncbi:MAG: acetyl-CoA C-acyltransferase [Flavobacteriaceae bacterium]
MNTVVIVAAQRTPLGSFMGCLSGVKVTDLGATAIRACLKKIELEPQEVEEVFMGHVLQAGTGQAPARQAALKAGIPEEVPCTTVNKVCASGMKAIQLAAQGIALGDIDIAIAGGMESMSQSPHLIPLRKGQKFGAVTTVDNLQHDGLTDAFEKVPMGVFADRCAQTYSITREQQDQYAIESYERSTKAHKQKYFAAEICPVEVPQRKGPPIIVDKDEEFENVKLEKIPVLQPAFGSEGTVTAANASTINDGAAAVVLMSAQKAKQLGLKPLAVLQSYADAALSPEAFTVAPAQALPKALEKANLSADDIDLFEINEAFSVVALANMQLLNIPHEKVNVHGGAVSLGHPIGCSGARIVVTLVHALQTHRKSLGAAAVCNGGGGASAVVLNSQV